MNRQSLLKLLQNTYFDNVDNALPDRAVEAFTPDVCWEHTQVWAHDGHNSGRSDKINGQGPLRDFLKDRIKQMQVIEIKHKIAQLILDGNSGAFRGHVVGPDGTCRPFIGWVEIEGDRISRYLVTPENFGAPQVATT